MSRKAFIKTLKSRSEVAAATLELIKKEQRRTQASLVYLSNDGAKDYKRKVLQDFLRQKGISHEVTERYCSQSNWLADRLDLTIMDKVRCMLIDANLTAKLWPCTVLMYNNLPHSALDYHKSPNDAYGDSSEFSKLYIFGSICYAFQPSKLLHQLEERLAKGLFLGIDSDCYKVLDLKSKVADVTRTVKVFDNKFLFTEKIKFKAFAEKKNQHSQVLWILHLQDLRILATHLKGLEKEDILPARLYTWSNHRVLMMDQADCVYFKSAYMSSNNREENGTFDI